jgi:hypothetical protein
MIDCMPSGVYLRVIFRHFWILAACCALQGCTLRYYELGTPLTAADQPNPEQEVMMSAVLDQLGPPQRISATPNGYVMAWEYWYITERTLGFSLGAGGTDFLSIDWGTANAGGDLLLLSFDSDHQLVTSNFEEWDGNAGVGRGVQPLSGFVDVVDVNDLLQPMPQHDWGGASLESLPTTLNSESRMDTGQNGIEQRGTTRSVGQHSLEMR